MGEFLQEKLNEKYEKHGLVRSTSPEKASTSRLKKELYFDFNRKKVKELLVQEKVTVKKDTLLPAVRNSDSREKKMRDSKAR